MRKFAQRLCSRAGIGPVANPKPGKHLSADHPSLQHVYNWVRYQTQAGTYHERLVGNFDQVWAVLFRPGQSTLQRKNAEVEELSRSLAWRKIRHVIERCLDKPFTEELPGQTAHKDAFHTDVTGGRAACTVVEGWRIPRTLCTLSWTDGSLGRGFVTCRDDTITEAQRATMNQAGQRSATHLECSAMSRDVCFLLR